MNRSADIAARIRSFRDSLKPKPGEKSAVQELLEDRAREKQHDDEQCHQWEARPRRRGIR
ncbi:MAG: hypothetical protein HY646_18410 [Acidobacteria bacterium]|nr:hypothetical protein [Acidobacteriota bacterium]